MHRFNFGGLAGSKTPADPNIRLEKDELSRASDESRHNYLEMFGSLNYLPIITRPDLAYAVSTLGRYNANPNQSYLDGMTRAYSYIVKTPDHGLIFKRGDFDLRGYVDADWLGYKDTRRATTGWVFILGGSPILWASKRQATVAQSSCEAEYVAASEAIKEAMWIKRFINDLHLPSAHLSNVPLYVDNNSAIKLAKNAEMHQRTKHIDGRHYFIRDAIRDGHISVKYFAGFDNPADIYTKALGRPTFEKHLRTLNILE